MKEKPKSVTVGPWLKANLGKTCLAPLTGTDYRALQAAVQIIELYAYDPDSSLLVAFAQVVGRMQEKTRSLAFHAIAHVMDWSDRWRLWRMAGFEGPVYGHCAFGPEGRAA